MHKTQMKQLLQSFSLFQQLSDEEMAAVIDIAQAHTFNCGSYVFFQGEQMLNVYFISKGTVKIYKTDIQGKEQIVSILKDGEMFPHVGFFRAGTYPAHAEVVEQATLLVISIEQFEQILLDNPKICIKIFRVLGEKIVDLQNRLEEKILHDSFEQIVRLLLRLANSYRGKEENGIVTLNTQFTNSELSKMIGTSRETVSRTINKLKKEKCVTTTADGFLALNIKKLEQKVNVI